MVFGFIVVRMSFSDCPILVTVIIALLKKVIQKNSHLSFDGYGNKATVYPLL